MKINRIELKNFRCFPTEPMNELVAGKTIELDAKLTVIVAENGQGKTAILDALRIGLWPFVSCFDLAKNHVNDPANGIAIEDIRLVKMPSGDMARQLPCEVVLQGDYGAGENTWIRSRVSEQKSTKIRDGAGVKELKSFATNLQEKTRDSRNSADTVLPILAYYGTGRLWAQKRLMESKKATSKSSSSKDLFVRTFGYLDCMDPASTYRHFKDWFIRITEAHFQEVMKMLQADHVRVPPDQLPSHVPIRVVQQATDCFLRKATGWHTLEYAKKDEDLILHHDLHGQIPVDQLSDGIRSVLAMIGDVAYRCYQLNPALGENAATQSKGLVLIDEVDMHLHPRWQQVVVSQLQEAFPQIQFVVTTHSPQVLSTVPKECIRIIRSDWTIEQPQDQTQGVESSLVLEQAMGTDPLPHVQIAEDMKRYVALIQQGVFGTEEVLQLKDKLYSHFGSSDARLRSAEALARFKYPTSSV